MASPNKAIPSTVHYRHDYAPPAWLVEGIDLQFNIHDKHVIVTALLTMHRNATAPHQPCALNGTAKLKLVELDGKKLTPPQYHLANNILTIGDTPEQFILKIVTHLNPAKNSQLMGLYASNGNLFTQCEPEGFRNITYYPDRPDVMACFTTTIVADKAKYPVLLSNGNKVASGQEGSLKHWVKWVDPHRKPAYLFALVAGHLVVTTDAFTTKSGKVVALEIWTEPGDEDKTAHAMLSLKQAMRWDETRFGLEYDLDIYMVVAVKHFNAGAMENKGLNIFNAQYVLGDARSATDDELANITRVIGHEYFHNWTGNRVTCKDWFQLSLKEGLTVFREQEFGATLEDPAIERIKQVKLLRMHQFPEDAGPTAHPVRPESYIEMNNFYTTTIYEKGAEVIRMYQTLLGQEKFRQGLQYYLQRHDGQAATCDDFLSAMSHVSGIDLTEFSRWYSQSGTPQIKVTGHYNSQQKSYTLTVTQHTQPTADQPHKEPLHIPLMMGLLTADGQPIPIRLKGETHATGTSRVLVLQNDTESFACMDIDSEPTPSLLRNFSAPVEITFDWDAKQLAFLIKHDSDLFSRWNASQTLVKALLLALYHKKNEVNAIKTMCFEAWHNILTDNTLTDEYKALLLTLPDENDMLAWLDGADPQRIYRTIKTLSQQLAIHFENDWWQIVKRPFPNDPSKQIGFRRLNNLSLAMLTKIPHATLAIKMAYEQGIHSNNMTDEFGALTALCDTNTIEFEQCLNAFSERWQHNSLVMDKYFALVASCRLPTTLTRVKKALKHPVFNLKNPNKLYALFRTFGRNAPIFHAKNGSGYRWFAKYMLKIDAFNPYMASHIIQAFNCCHKIDTDRQQLMHAPLLHLFDQPRLSSHTREIVKKILDNT